MQEGPGSAQEQAPSDPAHAVLFPLTAPACGEQSNARPQEPEQGFLGLLPKGADARRKQGVQMADLESRAGQQQGHDQGHDPGDYQQLR